MPSPSFHRARGVWFFFALPALVLIAAYASICFAEGSVWPWSAMVHESGDKSLLDTLLYYPHATRELPPDLVLGAAVAAAALALGYRPRADAAPRRSFYSIGSALVVVVIVVGTLAQLGFNGFVSNLAQLYTRPGAAPEWGAHWRYHQLSRASLIFAAPWVFGMYAWLAIAPASRPNPRPYFTALGVFALLSLIFIPTLEPFLEPRFLGHQAREAATHVVVTLPLCVGVCLRLSGTAGERRFPGLRTWIFGAASLTLALYVVVGSLMMSATDSAQSESLVSLVSVHFFEHGFTYLISPLFSGWCFLLARPE